jgi:hypothetical protein
MKKKCKKCKPLVKRIIEGGNPGYIVNKDVFVQAPPIVPTFYLPSEEDIAKLKVGDTIKLIFVDKDGGRGERMWVQITNQLDSTPVEWVGKLDNHPFSLEAKAGDIVRFSPKAIINIYNEADFI